jgi:hypothetical protein
MVPAVVMIMIMTTIMGMVTSILNPSWRSRWKPVMVSL